MLLNLFLVFTSLFFCNLANASENKIGIRKDVISVENGTVAHIEQTVLYDNVNNYVERTIYSPRPSLKKNTGRGVLYHFDESFNCNPQPRESSYFKNNFVRIAAINFMHQGSKCKVKSYIEQIKFDGAKGALIYSDSNNVNDLKKIINNELKNEKVDIPIYIIDYPVGDFLKSQIQSIENENENNISNSPQSKQIFITLISDEKKSTNIWKIILILIFVLFSTYVLFKVKAQNKYSKTLQESDLKHLKTELVSTSLKNNINTTGSIFDSLEICSMCIEDFSVGNKLRILPCNHKFHASCIDPWLLNQSALCPICKVDTRKILHTNSSDFINVALRDNDPNQNPDIHYSRSLDNYLKSNIETNNKLDCDNLLLKNSSNLNNHNMNPYSNDYANKNEGGVYNKIKESVFKIKLNVFNFSNKQKKFYPQRSVSFEKSKHPKNKRYIKVLTPDQAVTDHSTQIASADFTFLTQETTQLILERYNGPYDLARIHTQSGKVS
ncbi:hypothetical protein BB561_005263 [Smittium simulii]|uniref:RING-type domain-containing protein n=1 Tax=Smittium simulii TaxID=133385 RepID=A0A2T9YBB0_9FUNG|nr:hypothetical protein BB561_005263 [Smittium simulii]